MRLKGAVLAAPSGPLTCPLAKSPRVRLREKWIMLCGWSKWRPALLANIRFLQSIFDSNVLLDTLARDAFHMCQAACCSRAERQRLGAQRNRQCRSSYIETTLGRIRRRAGCAARLVRRPASADAGNQHRSPRPGRAASSVVLRCFIVASALETGCTTLLSKDPHHGLSVSDRHMVQIPFRDL